MDACPRRVVPRPSSRHQYVIWSDAEVGYMYHDLFLKKNEQKKAKQNLKQIIITTVSQNINEIKVCIYKDPVDVSVFAF